MRKAFAAACAAAAVLLVFACSSSTSHPPVEGCTGAGCGSSGGGGSSGASSSSGANSSGSSGGDAATTCGVASNDSQCTLCLAQRCCTQLQGCTSDMACNDLGACVIRCGGGSTCINMCEQTYPSGSSLYEALSSCSQSCMACTEAGTGDPCGNLSSYPCAQNLSCNGQWCTRSCVQDSDCAGLGVNGGNYLGRANACIRTANGALTCAPGCNGPGDCVAFPGTTCRSATDASGPTSLAFVCGSLSDASAD